MFTCYVYVESNIAPLPMATDVQNASRGGIGRIDDECHGFRRSPKEFAYTPEGWANAAPYALAMRLAASGC